MTIYQLLDLTNCRLGIVSVAVDCTKPLRVRKL